MVREGSIHGIVVQHLEVLAGGGNHAARLVVSSFPYRVSGGGDAVVRPSFIDHVGQQPLDAVVPFSRNQLGDC